VVAHPSVGDGEQPGLEIGARPVAAKPAQHRLERLAGHVLRLVGVAEARAGETGHAVPVAVVEVPERVEVAGLGTLDQDLDVDLDYLGHRCKIVPTRGPLQRFG
jgi:hypothetical protein